MEEFTAYFVPCGKYGTQICKADTIDELIKTLIERKYSFHVDEKERIINWSNGKDKKYYGTNITIRRGELEMTDYTSF